MSDLRNSFPVFILGCDRSGTSLLRRIFNSHKNIACPTETKFIFQFVKVFETYQSLQGLKNMGYSERDILEGMREFICRFLDGYVEKYGKKRWAEKTTHNVNCAETIDRIFDGKVLYVAIVRHGLDVAYSLDTLTYDKFTVIDKYRDGGADTATAGIRHWLAMNRRIVEFQAIAGDRLKLIRYEELTSCPEKVLREVCEFIGESWDARMLEYNTVEHDSGWEDPNAGKLGRIVTNSNRYLSWPQDYQVKLFDEGREMLEYFGYKL